MHAIYVIDSDICVNLYKCMRGCAVDRHRDNYNSVKSKSTRLAQCHLECMDE